MRVTAQLISHPTKLRPKCRRTLEHTVRSMVLKTNSNRTESSSTFVEEIRHTHNQVESFGERRFARGHIRWLVQAKTRPKPSISTADGFVSSGEEELNFFMTCHLEKYATLARRIAQWRRDFKTLRGREPEAMDVPGRIRQLEDAYLDIGHK